MKLLSRSTLVLSLALVAGCVGSRTEMDPTLIVRTSGGLELGVSTDYGVVFLGRTARSGDVEVTSWFGDGPNIESSVIEPVGGGVYTVDTEIRLPTVSMTFRSPAAGDEVEIVGRRGEELWRAETTVVRDPRVEGVLLRIPGDLRNSAEQVGAGVFWVDPDTERALLLGLVSGSVTLTDTNGRSASYLTIVGPKTLWRLVTHRREFRHKRRWVYREDIL